MVLAEEPKIPIDMGFDYFLNPEYQALARDRPLEFNPDDGHDFRKVYEDKYGYRGERLIAMLGGGAAPLSILDASLLDRKTTTTSAPITEEGVFNTTETAENVTSEAPTLKRKDYLEINREDRKKGFLTESFLQNNIPQHESFKISPEGVIYKRLYGAIWNHGAKGLPKGLGLEGITGLRRLGIPGLPGFYSPSWTEVSPNFGKQIATSLQAQLELDSDVLSQPNQEFVNKPSQKEFAGVGEPSIMVQSYSYW